MKLIVGLVGLEWVMTLEGVEMAQCQGVHRLAYRAIGCGVRRCMYADRGVSRSFLFLFFRVYVLNVPIGLLLGVVECMSVRVSKVQRFVCE